MFKPKVFEVAPGIYCIYRKSYYNCTYLVHRNNEVILIDASMKSSGNDVFYAMKQLGLPLKLIKAILITHWHNDHTAGTKAVKDATHAKVYCHPADVPNMDHSLGKNPFYKRIADAVPELGALVLFKGLIGEMVPRAVKIDQTITDGDVLHDSFEVIATPGHTPGHVAFYDQASKTLFAGDALACIRGKLRFMARPVTPDLAAARQSMQKVLDHDIALICPGHRQPLTQQVQSEIDRMRKYLDSNDTWPYWG
ncbi:hypothetical protein BKI52_45170 [marine bacterium AO1-C]|nr:hypothetical protein BKI52_45170 [marine bacterium AO1-C]